MQNKVNAMRTEVPKENYAIVLDFLQHGHPLSGKRIPIVQLIGEEKFTLLEAVPKKGIFLKPHERVYIGPEKREKIHHVIGKIKPKDLTQTARTELPFMIEELINKDESKFVDFFNRATAVTTRLHRLELIPGIGKKHMWKILKEREEKKFNSFGDLKKRIELIPDPKKAVVKRIIKELEGNDKYRVFTS